MIMFHPGKINETKNHRKTQNTGKKSRNPEKILRYLLKIQSDVIRKMRKRFI